MPAYIVGLVEVTDPESYNRYRARTPEVIAQYGGHFVIRGGEPQVLEGDWPAPRVVVIAFPDEAAARRFYESPEYQEIVPIRQGASNGTLALLPGAPATG
jgi:uncharacterized protein (DUF1330 family)